MTSVSTSTTCEVFVCGSVSTGHILLFDIHANQFQLISNQFKLFKDLPYVVFSPCRRAEFLLPTDEKTIICLHAESIERIRAVKKFRLKQSIRSISFDRFGTRVAIANSDDTISTWNAGNFKLLQRIRFPPLEKSVQGAEFTPKTGKLAVVFDLFILLIENDKQNGKTYSKRGPNKVKFEIPQFVDDDRMPMGNALFKTLAISSEEKTMVCGSENGYVAVWDIPRARVIHCLEVNVDKIMFFFEVEEGSNIRKDEIITESQTHVAALSKRGNTKVLLIIDVRSKKGEVLHEITTGLVDMVDFDIGKEGKKLIVLYKNSSIHFYDIETLVKHYGKLNMIESERLDPLNVITRVYSVRNDFHVRGYAAGNVGKMLSVAKETKVVEKKLEEFRKSQSLELDEDILDIELSLSDNESGYSVVSGDEEYLKKFSKFLLRKNVRNRFLTLKPGKNGSEMEISGISASGVFRGRKNMKKKVREKKITTGSVTMDITKMKKFLVYHGQFPGQYRGLVWRKLSKLPENKDQFSHLLKHGFEFELKTFDIRFDTKNKASLRRIRKIISLLGNLSTVYTVAEFVPQVIYPFERIYRCDSISIFEIILTFFTNWGKDWLVYYPKPPFKLLKRVEKILRDSDEAMYEHLKLRCGSKVYCWDLIKSLFTDVLTEQEWLVLFDHVFCYPLMFFYCFNVAFLVHNRNYLLSFHNKGQFVLFLEKRPENFDLEIVISLAKEIFVRQLQSVSNAVLVLDDDLEYLNNKLASLPKGKYPIFVKKSGEENHLGERNVIERRKQIEEEERELLSRTKKKMKKEKEGNRYGVIGENSFKDIFSISRSAIKENRQRSNSDTSSEMENELEISNDFRIPKRKNFQNNIPRMNNDSDSFLGVEKDFDIPVVEDDFVSSMRSRLMEQQKRITELEKRSLNRSREVVEKEKTSVEELEEKLKYSLNEKQKEIEELRELLKKQSEERSRKQSKQVKQSPQIFTKTSESPTVAKKKEEKKTENKFYNLNKTWENMKQELEEKIKEENVVESMNETFATPMVRKSAPTKEKSSNERKKREMKRSGALTGKKKKMKRKKIVLRPKKGGKITKEIIRERFSKFLQTKEVGTSKMDGNSTRSSPNFRNLDINSLPSSVGSSQSSLLLSGRKFDDIYFQNTSLTPMTATPVSIGDSEISTADIDVNVSLTPDETSSDDSKLVLN